jgi:acyl-[acyl-carrier-protein]-phospholipid O-acyltransferase/long-chain-fatty-acid--[acyl-carrier-protein] ligase
MPEELSLGRHLIRVCKAAPDRLRAVDSTGGKLTGGDLLLRSLVLRQLLLREALGANEPRVGVLLPPSTGAATVNSALALAGRVAVNLNYTASQDVVNACIEAAGIRHVLTSAKVMEKLGMKLDCQVVELESLKSRVRLTDKLAAAWGAKFSSAAALERRLGVDRVALGDTATILFTSGSTGRPKGVVLSHGNVLANIRAIQQAVRLSPDDVILGILPFFHAFGFTVTMWAPVVIGMQAAYHFNPLDARQVGKLCKESGGTILLSTPTFLRSYLKRVEKDEFATIDAVIVGAEKLPGSLSDAFEERFGVRPSEGYGVTEMSPVVSVNIPPSRSSGLRVDAREGSIGQCLPGVSARVVDLDTRAPLPAGAEGMLEVSGPNLMQGYLDDPQKTAEVGRDGWYTTGDIARIDDEGFLFITGRQSRFSKIGGEMVPHVRVEEELQHILSGGDQEELRAVVTAVPDSRKGERLVVVHLPMDRKPDAVCRALQNAGLPNLWVPSPDSFVEVDSLPLLGSGKLDLKGLATLALERCGEK